MAKSKKIAPSRRSSAKGSRTGKRGIHAVAELAGVSIATVSRVMNGVPSVDAKLSRKVWKAVSEIDYVPNRHAQALISGRTHLIGLLVSDIINPFFPELIQGFEQAATAEGFGILIGVTNGAARQTEAWVERMLQHGVEGMALLTFAEEPDSVYSLLKKTPAVQIEVSDAPTGLDVVEVDFQIGLREAVQHLAGLGHRDIVFAAGPHQDFTAALRQQCFRNAMREIGIVIDAGSIFEEHHTLEGGIEAARRILARKTMPTALVCSNDLMAIGALKHFHAHGLHIPNDLSLIGLDDIHLTEFTSPPLTTVRIPRIELAATCFQVLFRKLRPQQAQQDAQGTPRVVSTSLVVRESTGRARRTLQRAAKKTKRL
ncbi:MAG: LacI family transcriptional regulator [Acidobacteriota bacterium]|nr:LacI family transcriptional regulator [Acidobacteriota bacterium]